MGEIIARMLLFENAIREHPYSVSNPAFCESRLIDQPVKIANSQDFANPMVIARAGFV